MKYCPQNTQKVRLFIYLSIKYGRQKAKMAATKLSFFVISTSDRGDFPRIIVIALLNFKINYFISSRLQQQGVL